MPAVMEAIDKMNTEERIQIMDYLWSVIESSTSSYQPPAWHATELERREKLYRSGSVPTSSWADVKARLDARRHAL